MGEDLDSTDANDFSFFKNDRDLFDFEQKGRSMVEKLKYLENELQQSRAEMQTLSFAKLELEKMLEKEKVESKEMKTQLKTIQETMQQWEKERTIQKDSSIRQSIELELLQKERNSLNEQIKNLKIKNTELELQNSEIQKQLRNQNDLECVFKSKKKKIDGIVDKIHSERQKLDQQFVFLKKQVTSSKHAGEQMIALLEHHHKALSRAYDENKSMKLSQMVLTGELQSERNKTIDATSHHAATAKKEIEMLQMKLKEREEMVSFLNQKIEIDIEEKKKLNETLNCMLQEQIRCNELENYFRNSISEWEKEKQ